MSKKPPLLLSCTFLFLISFSQDTESEYYKLQKKSKKPNVTHVAFEIGLGMSNYDNLRKHETGTTTFNNQTHIDNSYVLDESRGLPMITAGIGLDFIETNKTYFGLSGLFSYTYSPFKIGSEDPDQFGNILHSKGKTHSIQYEAMAKVGAGAAKFKVYFGASIGNMIIDGYYKGGSVFTTNGTTFTSVDKDSITYDLGYLKAMFGFRIGSNRKNVFDINFYKWVVNEDFFVQSSPPSILKKLTSFGKYEQFPALPFGASASYTMTGKYKFGVDFRFFRDFDFVSENANVFIFHASKQFDFHNRKKK